MTSNPILRLMAAATIGVSLYASHKLKADPANATFLLLNVTNTPSGHIATFMISNGTPAHIACIPEAIERSTNQTWARTPLFNKPRLTRNWSSIPEELQPNQTASFKVPTPYTNATWRLIFCCVEQKPITDRATDLVRHLTNTNAAQANSHQFSGRHYSITSPEVHP